MLVLDVFPLLQDSRDVALDSPAPRAVKSGPPPILKVAKVTEKT